MEQKIQWLLYVTFLATTLSTGHYSWHVHLSDHKQCACYLQGFSKMTFIKTTHTHTQRTTLKIILCAVLAISRQELHQLSSVAESCRRWMVWIMHLQEQIPHWMPVDTPAHLSFQYCCHLMHIPFILQPVTFFLPSIKKHTTVNAVLVISL